LERLSSHGAGTGLEIPGLEVMPTRVTSNAAALPTPDDRATLEALRRKLGFRTWHRGTCEADLLVGAFADQCLMEFAAEELRQFERLLEEDDPVQGVRSLSVLLVARAADGRSTETQEKSYEPGHQDAVP
jgi:hypothetical protein